MPRAAPRGRPEAQPGGPGPTARGRRLTQTPRRQYDDVVSRVRTDQDPDVARDAVKRRARVVEIQDLAIGQTRSGRTLGAVLTHAVTVAKSVADHGEVAVCGDLVGLRDADPGRTAPQRSDRRHHKGACDRPDSLPAHAEYPELVRRM